MKAKEYFVRFDKEGRTNMAAAEVWLDMLKEFKTIADARHATSDAAGVSIFKELNQKWKAFARLTDGQIREDGFVEMFKKKCPDTYLALTLSGFKP